MFDFSLFSLFTAGLALFAATGDAYTKPVGDMPEGNPITQPGFMSIVPAGKPFTVTWEPTTDGTVTLVLLKGPSENAQPQYAIAEKIENDGSFEWTPKKDLEPTADATGYGIQLIVDKTGQYQYTTQFGISNPAYDASSDDTSSSAAPSSSSAAPSSSSAAPSSSFAAPSSTSSSDNWSGHGGYGGHGGHGHGGWGHGGHNVHGGYSHPAASGSTSSSSSSSSSSLSASYTHHKGNGTTSAGHARPTGWAPHNITMIQPTGGYSSSAPIASSSAAGSYGGSSAAVSTPAGPQATDSGARTVASSLGGLVLAAGAAVFAL